MLIIRPRDQSQRLGLLHSQCVHAAVCPGQYRGVLCIPSSRKPFASFMPIVNMRVLSVWPGMCWLQLVECNAARSLEDSAGGGKLESLGVNVVSASLCRDSDTP